MAGSSDCFVKRLGGLLCPPRALNATACSGESDPARTCTVAYPAWAFWQGSSPEMLPQAWGAWNIRQMQGLFKTITRATRKSAAPSAVSNPGVTLMPLVVEATDTHCRPEDLGAQTTPPKKEKGNSNHGTEQDEPTCQMNEGRRKPKTEFRQETGSGTYAELSKVQKE